MNGVLTSAIENRNLIEFKYSGDLRKVEPHLLGKNKAGVMTLSAWQTEGKSGIGWRGYSVDKISELKIADCTFDVARPGYNPNDNTMIQIFSRV
jgi:hypothetical protein